MRRAIILLFLGLVLYLLNLDFLGFPMVNELIGFILIFIALRDLEYLGDSKEYFNCSKEVLFALIPFSILMILVGDSISIYFKSFLTIIYYGLDIGFFYFIIKALERYMDRDRGGDLSIVFKWVLYMLMITLSLEFIINLYLNINYIYLLTIILIISKIIEFVAFILLFYALYKSFNIYKYY